MDPRSKIDIVAIYECKILKDDGNLKHVLLLLLLLFCC